MPLYWALAKSTTVTAFSKFVETIDNTAMAGLHDGPFQGVMAAAAV